MRFSFFKKKPQLVEVRPRFEQDTELAEELKRRVESIAFQPSKGFLKDSSQPKRRPTRGLGMPKALQVGKREVVSR